MEDHVALKLPKAFDGFTIDIHNRTDVNLRLQQNKAVFVDGRWIVDVYLIRDDDHLKLIPGA